MRISIHFNLVKGGSTADDLPIRIRISYDGLRLDLRSGFVCHPDKWDDEHERMKTGTTNRYGEKASKINSALSKMYSAVTDILARYEIDGKIPEPQVLKADFNKTMGRKERKGDKPKSTSESSFIEVFKAFLLSKGKELSSGTIVGYKNVLNHLQDFSFAENPPDELTQRNLSDFINELEIENQTMSVYLSKIKAVLRWARREGLYHGTLPEDFMPKLKGLGNKDVHYLEWSDFEKLLYLNLINDTHVAVRDAFCFCCATGLRVSDCAKLKWADVHLDCANPYIHVVTKKTTKPINIELNKWSRAIIDRQPTYRPVVMSNTVFPEVSLSSRNTLLPVIARLANIEGQVREISFVGNRCTETIVDKADAISTHWGRHTFVVHALHLGISPEVIISWTGHSSTASLKPYIAISNKTKIINMAKFDE